MADKIETYCQIYLLLPRTLNQGNILTLQKILDQSEISCVLVRQSGKGGFDHNLLNSVIGIVQSHNVACLIDNDWDLALKLGADGIHLSQEPDSIDADSLIASYEKARATLGDDAIVGALCHSRHVAMVLGEKGAQYIALPAQLEASEELTAHEQIQWWSELFETPSVVWDVKDINDIDAFVSDGADFLAFGDTVWNQDEPTDTLRVISKKLS